MTSDRCGDERSFARWDLLDGGRFLFNVNVRAGATDPLTLVQGWQAGLER